MLKKVFIILIAVFGIVTTIFNPVVMGLLAIIAWVYLVVVIWKKDINIFLDKMEYGVAKKNLNRMKVLLIISAISILIAITGIVLHNVQHGLSIIGDDIYFYMGIAALYIFILATSASLFIYLKSMGKIN